MAKTMSLRVIWFCIFVGCSVNGVLGLLASRMTREQLSRLRQQGVGVAPLWSTSHAKVHVRNTRHSSTQLGLLNNILQSATGGHSPSRNWAPVTDLQPTVFTHLAADISKFIQGFLHKSENPTVMAAMSAWKILPPVLKRMLTGMAFGDLFLFIFFQLTYRRACRMAHQLQIFSWKWLALGKPLDYPKSILGFAEDRGGLLAKIMGCNYLFKIFMRILQKLGFRVDPGLPNLISKIAYTLYAINFIDLFKSQFLHIFLPYLADNRRQSYVVNRSTSVIIWVVGVLGACEMVSTYFKVPLSSTLAFGGVGGIALGLSARDIAANFLGGMLLLFNEPFTPGDMVTFRSGSTELVGRVERVGWGQTRIRGRDTRPTYVPNSHFVQAAVTNMERITHRKFEATIPIRFQDHVVMPEILAKIKDALRSLPKLDLLSMPFRVSFVKFGAYALEIEITCYFATKSIDEFLALQQMANLEVVRVIRECGAQLALPTTQLHMPASAIDPAQAFIGQLPVAISVPTPASQPALTTTKVTQTQVTTASVVVPTAPPPQAVTPKSSSGTDPVVSSPSTAGSSKKKDLPPFAPTATTTTTTAASTTQTATALVIPATPLSKPASNVAALSPAAAAILAEAQTGSIIAEKYNGRTSSPTNQPDQQQQRRVVVGQTINGGPPMQLPSPQPDPRVKKVSELPQQPLPPTASTPPSSTIPRELPPAATGPVPPQASQQQTSQSLAFQQQLQQQQQLLRQQMQASMPKASPRKTQNPLFSKDGSISWSWIEIEESIIENGEDDSGGLGGSKETW